MKRKIFLILTVICLCFGLAIPVLAAPVRLVDDAALLTGGEVSEIAAQLDKVSARYSIDVVIVTANELGGLSPMEYADDFFDYGGYGKDGILLLVSMEDRDWWISTTGYGITAVTDAGLDYIADQFVPYLSEDDYGGAFTVFVEQCDLFLAQAETGDPFDSHNLPKAPFAALRNLGVALVIGVAAGWIATGVMKNKLKSVAMQPRAEDYIVPGSMRLSYSRDQFLYSHTDRREKPKSSSGSSTHTSSSGTTHGGGGGKF